MQPVAKAVKAPAKVEQSSSDEESDDEDSEMEEVVGTSTCMKSSYKQFSDIFY